MKILKLMSAIIMFSLASVYSCKEEDEIPVITANAGMDVTTLIEKTVMLDASNSMGMNIEYIWVVNDPQNNAVTLSDPSAVSISFIAEMPGVYMATIQVTNGISVNSATVMVTVENPTYELADQMGRPAINTVFNFFGDADTKNGYNQTLPSEGVGNANNFKGIFDALQSYIGLDPSTYKNILGLDNATTSSVLATDVLGSNKSAPSTYGPSDLNDLKLGENLLNGRGLADDVVDVTLILAFAGNDLNNMSPTQMGLISDNVQSNDKNFLTTFPYLAEPH